MSRLKISPYPTLTSECVATNLGARVLFRYTANHSALDIEEIKEGHCRVMSPSWRPRSDEMTVSVNVEIDRPQILFCGKGEDSYCRVASDTSRIGIALKWVLPETKIRGVVVAKTTLSSDTKGPVRILIEHTFPAAAIRNRVEFDVGLFLFKAGDGRDDVYARTVGSELGSLGANVLHTGGSGGMFMTTAAKLGSASPLWDLQLNIDDESDLQRDFSGDICTLFLNEEHPLYPELVQTGPKGEVSPLMFEIFAQSCVMLFLRGVSIMEHPEQLDENIEDEGDGMSVLSVLRYMKKRLLPENWSGQLESEPSEKISLAIRRTLTKQMKILVPEKKEGGLF